MKGGGVRTLEKCGGDLCGIGCIEFCAGLLNLATWVGTGGVG